MTPFWNSCTSKQQKCGAAALTVLHIRAPTAAGTKAAAKQCRQHYVGREWLKLFGRKALAEKLKTVLPVSKSQRSGDLGEILATEYVNLKLWGYEAPVLRLRWKDGRDLALRGDDVIGFDFQVKPVGLLKGEAKSRATITSATLNSARSALRKNNGLPGAFSLEFIVEQLVNAGQKKIARRVQEEACGARLLDKRQIAHLMFVLSGNNPVPLMEAHLSAIKSPSIQQYAVAVHCDQHQTLIAAVFKEASHA